MAMAEQQSGVPDSSTEQEFSPKTAQAVKGSATSAAVAKRAPRRPSPEEMIEYYGRKGLSKQAAAEKVIDDLQKALTIAVSRNPRAAHEPVRSVSGTLDSLTSRLGAVEAKVDEKPDLGGVFVAGVAAGGFLQAVPHVFRAIAQVGRGVQDVISRRQ